MPNGWSSPCANTAFFAGCAAPSAARITRTRPGWVSATKTSPLGATRITRGLVRPVTNGAAVKPGSVCSSAPAGRGTTLEGARPSGAGRSGGRSATVIWRVTPGASARQSPNAAGPVRVAAAAGMATAAASAMAVQRFIGGPPIKLQTLPP